MRKLPHPPASLPRGGFGRTVLPANQLLWRVYRAAGPHPVGWGDARFFGPVPTGRFDHQEPPPCVQSLGILYAALSVAAAVVETFQDTRTIDRRRQEPWLAGFRLNRDLLALDLRGRWPTRAGASQAIASGRRDVAQEWSRAIHRAYADVEGLIYPSALAGARETNLALYERGLGAVPAQPDVNIPLSHPGLADDLNRIAEAYGYDLR